MGCFGEEQQLRVEDVALSSNNPRPALLYIRPCQLNGCNSGEIYFSAFKIWFCPKKPEKARKIQLPLAVHRPIRHFLVMQLIF